MTRCGSTNRADADRIGSSTTATADIDQAAPANVYHNANPPSWARTHDEIASWLDGLRLVEPGLVTPRSWRPEPGEPGPDTPGM